MTSSKLQIRAELFIIYEKTLGHFFFFPFPFFLSFHFESNWKLHRPLRFGRMKNANSFWAPLLKQLATLIQSVNLLNYRVTGNRLIFASELSNSSPTNTNGLVEGGSIGFNPHSIESLRLGNVKSSGFRRFPSDFTMIVVKCFRSRFTISAKSNPKEHKIFLNFKIFKPEKADPICTHQRWTNLKISFLSMQKISS